MPDWGKPKRQPRERTGPPPRDPRVDSAPPSRQEDRSSLRPSSSRPPSSRPTPGAAVSRVAHLEADVGRLRDQHASDADQLAEMLVRLAALERATAAAENRAAESDQHAETLSVALGQEKARSAQLEADGWEASDAAVRDTRAQFEALQSAYAATQKELGAVREAMMEAMALLEELERREEMVGSVRMRAIEQMRRTLGAAVILPPAPVEALPIQATPIRSIAPLKPIKESMAEPEPFIDLAISDS